MSQATLSPSEPVHLPLPAEVTPATSWRRWGIWVLLAGTTLMYLWTLGRNGYANSFYSAAVQAGSESWKAFFYGSSDAANSITVDKPPASLWVMALSVRMFGLNAWSILVPQALMGVASVGVLYLAVKRWYGVGAGLIAGAILATTPVATLMFRFNNPDALLVLLLVVAAYAVVRAIEKASPAWLMLAGVLVGFGFLTKMMQAFLVLPAFVIAYVVAAPTGIGKRIRDLVLAFVAMVIAGGWWVAIVELVPASSRPYIGGSQNNSVLDLILGYNGLGRITGNEVGSVTPGTADGAGAGGGPGGAGGPFSQGKGIGRLFESAWSGQIAWLIPTALILLVAGIWLTRKAARTDRLRAGLIIWGGWGLVTWAIFSFSGGIIHEYYAVALAPAIGALVGIGMALCWPHRGTLWVRLTMGAAVISAGVMAAWIMGHASGWYGTTGIVIGLVAALAGVVLASPFVLEARIGRAAAMVAVLAMIAGPLVFSVQTVFTTQSGSIPSAGPALAGATSGMGRPGGGPGQTDTGQTGTGQAGAGQTGAGQGGGAGGLLNAPAVGSQVVSVLNADADQFTWVAAGIGSMTTAGYQLATDNPVMPIGGFNGTDPSPTLEEFQQYVADSQIHYFISGGGFGNAMGGSSSSSSIATWVSENFTSTTVDGVVLYDLTAPVGNSGADATGGTNG